MEYTPTMGSLFSGFGGFEIAAERHGAKVLWQSEIEPWAVHLLKKRFPDVIQLGDIRNIDGSAIHPVDIITFGSPCQDMSCANGKRAGLAGKRSGLFMEAIRVIREMRAATNGEYPKYIIWENVPGAFTSNNRCDFKAVLEEITETEIPMPHSRRWADAGMVRGRKCDISWRILDARGWGVPQRRKRILLVGDYRTRRSSEILFKPKSLSRHTPKSGETRERIAACIKKCIGMANEVFQKMICLNDQGGNRMDISENITGTLRAESHHPPCVVLPCVFDARGNGDGQTVPTITGDHNGRISDYTAVLCEPYAIDCRNITANKTSGTLQINGNSLNSVNPVAVPILMFQGQASSSAELSISDKVSPTLQCKKNVDILIGYIVRRLTPSECAKLQGFPADWHKDVINDKGKPLPDTAAYKGYGNAVATVCAEYPIANIIEILREGNH